MQITECRLYWGGLVPDPSYKNLYLYDAIAAYATPKNFLAGLSGDISHFDFTFPEGSKVYAISETATGFSVELPIGGDAPTRPAYMVFTDENSRTRYAFIDNYTVTAGGSKARFVCRFDQWSENYQKLIATEFKYSRRHQSRYVNRTATPRTKLYNGLNDPIPEGMVQGKSVTDPVHVYGAKSTKLYDTANCEIIPVWLYWRIAAQDYFIDNDANPKHLYGVDAPKFAVPIVSTCLGVIEYTPSTGLSVFHFLTRIIDSTNTTICKLLEYDEHDHIVYNPEILLDTLQKGHPYIVQSWITTIPPFNCSFSFDPDNVGATITKPVLKILDSEYNDIKVESENHTYKIGLTGSGNPAQLTLNRGTFVSYIPKIDSAHPMTPPFPKGQRIETTIRTNTETGDFSDAYEPKIEESPYAGQTLMIYGAEIDISPTPATPTVTLSLSVGSHGDLVLKTGTSGIYRAAGVCSQFGVDAATDSLTNWLLSNFQTYQNTKKWKAINAGIGAVTSIGAGVATGNVAQVVGGGTGLFTKVGEMVTGEQARIKDLQASPNSTTIASENAFDNFPWLDLPLIRRRVIPDTIKGKINYFWKVYGYPDNTTAQLSTVAGNRESFVYVEAAAVSPIGSLLPVEQSEILAALRSGAWIWRPTLHTEVDPSPSTYITVERGKLFSNITNKEVV